MADSAFDPATFMNQETAGPMETRYTPVPEADYTATIGGEENDVVVRKAGDSILLDVTYIVHDEALAEKMGMSRLSVRQGIFLDVGGNGVIELGPNKNVKLGRLREAVGQNKPAPWNFAMLRGAGPLLLSVIIKPDETDPTVLYNRVTKTLAMPSGTGPATSGAPRAAAGKGR